jgi:hypothetical protein
VRELDPPGVKGKPLQHRRVVLGLAAQLAGRDAPASAYQATGLRFSMRSTILCNMHSFLSHALTALRRLRGGAIDVSNVRYERCVKEVNQRDKDVIGLSDDGLRQRAAILRRRVASGESLDAVALDAFAVIREAAHRTLGMRPFDVQVLAALAMHDGKLVEVQTGEGKTLAAVLPASLRAFLGRGVHVLTFNDYLAARDATWMGPAYRFLGLSVGHVEQGMSLAERRAAYACDVTYVTAKEAGFDFLRDQVCLDGRQLVHRGFHFAIVDEADSILIDEAFAVMPTWCARCGPATTTRPMSDGGMSALARPDSIASSERSRAASCTRRRTSSC